MSQPNVVIVGAGFAGIRVAKGLSRAKVKVTVIDRSNHHLFQPLLYQVATATLSPAAIASPIRGILRYQANTEVVLAEVTGVNSKSRRVLAGEREFPFDYLVLATGARHSYFGHDEWEKFAPGLKAIPDATAIRQKILYAFELAEMESDATTRENLLRFILVGGGPTGVEMAGAIAELSHRALASDFRRIDPRSAKVILIEAGPRLLNAFPEMLSLKAKKSLERLGVEVMLNARVQGINETGVALENSRIFSRTVIWTAGVMASPVGKWLGVETDRAGRVKVGADLSLPGEPNVFVLGDAAHVLDEKGQPLPGVAPVAMQEGQFIAELIRKRIAGKATPKVFRYFNKGNLATVGRSSAVADLGRVHLSGWLAWMAWLFVHIFYLIGFRNRLIVMTEWAWAYFTFQRGSRLIYSDYRKGVDK